MADRPIIFSGPMVRALLDGKKTQTRRLATSPLQRCEPGDRLYVRECFAEVAEGYLCITAADYPQCVPAHFENVPPATEVRWSPSIHMPRRRSRLTLIITDVRQQSLQTINDEDAWAEGVGTTEHWLGEAHPPREAFRSLWSSLHGRESWVANPAVVALTFRVVRGNIDEVAR